MTRRASLQGIAALLLVLATIVFLAGITAERASGGENAEMREAELAAAASGEETAEPTGEGAENLEGGEAAEGERNEGGEAASELRGEEAEEGDEEASELLFGVNLESNPAIAAAVTTSLLLAAALWFWGTPTVLVIAAGFALVFAALDLREVLGQVDESRGGLAAVALSAAVLHIGVAVVAGLVLVRGNTWRAPA